jgi:hypothetical protein
VEYDSGSLNENGLGWRVRVQRSTIG